MATESTGDAESVLKAIRAMALQTGRKFVLASGKESDYFLDMKPVLNDADTLIKIARLVHARVPPETDAVGGLAMGSIPISTAVIILRKQKAAGKVLRSFWVRPEPKQHGLGGIISGRLSPGDRVVVVDDVTTTGSSVRKAVEVVQASGAFVLKVISVVDRQEGASQTFSELGVPFESLYRRTDILAH